MADLTNPRTFNQTVYPRKADIIVNMFILMIKMSDRTNFPQRLADIFNALSLIASHILQVMPLEIDDADLTPDQKLLRTVRMIADRFNSIGERQSIYGKYLYQITATYYTFKLRPTDRARIHAGVRSMYHTRERLRQFD